MRKRLNEKTPETFWAQVKKGEPNECWEWQGAKNAAPPNHYGKWSYQSKQWRTHRLAWYLTYGDIPQGMMVCHTCDNPPCCNPAHLWLGTNSDNILDCVRKGRLADTLPKNLYIGMRHPCVKLTDEQVLEIRRLSKEGYSQGLLGEMFDISKTNIYFIVHRKKWKHLP